MHLASGQGKNICNHFCPTWIIDRLATVNAVHICCPFHKERNKSSGYKYRSGAQGQVAKKAQRGGGKKMTRWPRGSWNAEMPENEMDHNPAPTCYQPIESHPRPLWAVMRTVLTMEIITVQKMEVLMLIWYGKSESGLSKVSFAVQSLFLRGREENKIIFYDVLIYCDAPVCFILIFLFLFKKKRFQSGHGIEVKR